MMWTGAKEGAQERVVYVDDALRISVDEFVGQYLHVAGEDHEIRLVLVNQAMDLLFRSLLVLFCEWYDRIGDFVEVRRGLIIRMVGDDQRYLACQLAALMAVEKINQAVVVLRHEIGRA